MNVHLRGHGPVARAIVEAWIARGPGSESGTLAWEVDALAIRPCVRSWSRAFGLHHRAGALHLGDGRSVVISDGAEPAAGATLVDASGWRPTIQRSKLERIEPASVLAAAPLLEILEAGPGLRWAQLVVVRGMGAGAGAGAGLVDEPGPREALAAALGKRLPGLLGKLAVSQLNSPQRGDSLQLSASLAPGASIEGARDLLTQSGDPRLESAPGASSDEALGSARVLVDGEAIHGVGPLLWVLAHYDPAASLAAAIWRRLL